MDSTAPGRPWWTHPLSRFAQGWPVFCTGRRRPCSCDLRSRAVAPCFCLGLDCQVLQSAGQPHFLLCPRLRSTSLAFVVKAVLFLIWLCSRNSSLYLAHSWEFSRMGPLCSAHSFVEQSRWAAELCVHLSGGQVRSSHLGSSVSQVSCGCQGRQEVRGSLPCCRCAVQPCAMQHAHPLVACSAPGRCRCPTGP